MNRIIQFIYAVMLVVAAVFVGIAIVGGTRSNITEYGSAEGKALIPVYEARPDDMTVEYTFDLSDKDKAADSVTFYTNHQFVYAYADGELIYSLLDSNYIFGTTTGSCYNFVKIPADSKTLTICIKAVYEEVAGRDYSFVIGDRLTVYKSKVAYSVLSLIISIISVVIGVLIVAYWFLFHKKAQQGPAVLYFGTVVFFLGVWCVNETEFVLFLSPNHAASSFVGYTLLMLMPIPFVQYIRKYFELSDRNICASICIASVLDFIVCVSLHISGLWGFKQSAFITQILLLVSVAYMIFAMVVYYRRNGNDHKLRINIFVLLFIFAGLAADTAAFYLGGSDTDVYGKLCILAYIGIMARENIKSYSERLREGVEAEKYREMAVRDSMTGVYNRMAYENWEVSDSDFNGKSIITFDLNGLKKCNDTYGHLIGDKYITESAHLIARTFEGVGNCYRIGGDEFCVVYSAAIGHKVEALMEQLEYREREFNAYSDTFKMAIAYGFSDFDGNLDKNIEDTRNRADKLMYAKKSEMKRVAR